MTFQGVDRSRAQPGSAVLDQFRAMSDTELVEQAGDVISAVLDYWEGDDYAIHEYGEIRAKHLLVALRERWPRKLWRHV